MKYLGLWAEERSPPTERPDDRVGSGSKLHPWSNPRPPVVRKWISERRVIKIPCLNPQDAVLSATTRMYPHLFVVSRSFVGRRTPLTEDRIVARAGSSAPRVLSLIDET